MQDTLSRNHISDQVLILSYNGKSSYLSLWNNGCYNLEKHDKSFRVVCYNNALTDNAFNPSNLRRVSNIVKSSCLQLQTHVSIY